MQNDATVTTGKPSSLIPLDQKLQIIWKILREIQLFYFFKSN